MFFIFAPIPGEMIQFDYIIFFGWVVQPPTRNCMVSLSDLPIVMHCLGW